MIDCTKLMAVEMVSSELSRIRPYIIHTRDGKPYDIYWIESAKDEDDAKSLAKSNRPLLENQSLEKCGYLEESKVKIGGIDYYLPVARCRHRKDPIIGHVATLDNGTILFVTL